MDPEAEPDDATVRTAAIVTLSLLLAAPGAAQETRTLSLEDAFAMARRNNPTFRQARNDRDAAEWRVREAYAAFLPGASANASARYVAAGQSSFGIFTAGDVGVGSTPYYLSDYSLGLNYTLDGSTFFGVPGARANRNAVDARIDAARFQLQTSVTRRYLEVLRARDRLEVARAELERAGQNHELASARREIGAATSIAVKRAEVERGRAEVDVLNAESALRTQKLRLVEVLGVPMETDFRLTTSFQVFEPGWTEEELLRMSGTSSPQLNALRAGEKAARADARSATSSYFPQLSLSAGFSGFTRQAGDEDFLVARAEQSVESQRESCQTFNQISAGLSEPLEGHPRNCSAIRLSDGDVDRILEGNDVFPFDFTESPFSVTMRVSIPVFQGFTRQRRVEEARAAADDARERRRAEELRLRAAVTESVDALKTQARVVEIEERNREAASEQLELTRERYAMGSASFLELQEAEASLATAERDHLDAVYTFHQQLTTLEEAVGRELRRVEESGSGGNGGAPSGR